MAAVGLLCLCLLASLVGSYPLTDESSNFEGPIFTPVSIGIPTAEEVSIGIPTAEEVSIGIPTAEYMKEHEADTKIGTIAPRSLKSLFGLGIGGNILGINAGAGISHGRGGWGEVGMHSGHPGYVPYYEEPNQYYY
ncbi:hypothetical protein J6590_079916 [Homalodisca vitripennis]|nr:hypothetical protein J6590_079916 [Homalodisca vitripennis]